MTYPRDPEYTKKIGNNHKGILRKSLNEQYVRNYKRIMNIYVHPTGVTLSTS